MKSDVAPIKINSRVMVPIRAISEKAGATVDFNYETNLVTISKGNRIVKLTKDNKTAYVNNEIKTLDVPATEINDRTMVPVRFVSEALGLNVDWDGVTETVIITSNNYNADLEDLVNQGVQNLTEIQKQAYIKSDIRSAEQIGKAIRIWLTDANFSDATNRKNLIENQLKNYSQLTNLEEYISLNYSSFNKGSYFAILENNKVKIAIASNLSQAKELMGTAKVYDGTAGWAYFEGAKNLEEDLKASLSTKQEASKTFVSENFKDNYNTNLTISSVLSTNPNLFSDTIVAKIKGNEQLGYVEFLVLIEFQNDKIKYITAEPNWNTVQITNSLKEEFSDFEVLGLSDKETAAYISNLRIPMTVMGTYLNNDDIWGLAGDKAVQIVFGINENNPDNLTKSEVKTHLVKIGAEII